MPSFLNSTQVRLKIARVLYKVVKIFYREDIRIIKRNNINFEIDLKEGIDLNLFVFGNFQSHVYNSKHVNIPQDGVILDVGGNIGVISHFFASKVPKGQVHAFEPTAYALGKFKRNMELNPDLAKRITLNNCFVSHTSSLKSDLVAYSSWKIAGKEDSNETKHEVHGGTHMDSSNVPSITLDEYCEENNIEKITAIKIDTDGYEMDVLKGAKQSLIKHKPAVIFELCTYLLEEHNIAFKDVSDFFKSIGYKIYNQHKTIEITVDNYDRLVPKDGGIDAFAFPEL